MRVISHSSSAADSVSDCAFSIDVLPVITLAWVPLTILKTVARLVRPLADTNVVRVSPMVKLSCAYWKLNLAYDN